MYTTLSHQILEELKKSWPWLDPSHYAILYHIAHLCREVLSEPTANQIQAWYMVQYMVPDNNNSQVYAMTVLYIFIIVTTQFDCKIFYHMTPAAAFLVPCNPSMQSLVLAVTLCKLVHRGCRSERLHHTDAPTAVGLHSPMAATLSCSFSCCSDSQPSHWFRCYFITAILLLL